MNERWLCLDCYATTGLDIHGRCAACNSNAVDSIESARPWQRLNPAGTPAPGAVASLHARVI